jgi:hypothetical protein
MQKVARVAFLMSLLLGSTRAAFAEFLVVYQQSSPPNGFSYYGPPSQPITNVLDTAFNNNVMIVSNFNDLGTLGATAIWVDGHTSSMPANDRAALMNFINSGHRVAMVGENSGFSGTWNSSILSVVGGSIGSDVSPGSSGAPLVVHPITDSIGEMEWGGVAAGTATTGLQVFQRANVVTLWGPQLNVLTVLDYDWLLTDLRDNPRFRVNVANFLAVPEPSSFGLTGVGLILGTAMIRRNRRVAGRVAGAECPGSSRA